jgi:hypothetical protein
MGPDEIPQYEQDEVVRAERFTEWVDELLTVSFSIRREEEAAPERVR